MDQEKELQIYPSSAFDQEKIKKDVMELLKQDLKLNVVTGGYVIIFPKDRENKKSAFYLLEEVDNALFAIGVPIKDKKYWGVVLDFNEYKEDNDGNSKM